LWVTSHFASHVVPEKKKRACFHTGKGRAPGLNNRIRILLKGSNVVAAWPSAFKTIDQMTVEHRIVASPWPILGTGKEVLNIEAPSIGAGL
jgi:hypothetical protein